MMGGSGGVEEEEEERFTMCGIANEEAQGTRACEERAEEATAAEEGGKRRRIDYNRLDQQT